MAQDGEQPNGGIWDTVFEERFSAEVLDSERWKEVHWHDFQKRRIDIADYKNGEGEADRRLRMSAATRRTDDKTVKYQGVRSVEPVVDLSVPTEVSFEVDWNSQANGCYLDAGLYLCPVALDTHPRQHSDWFRMIYVGVPPGRLHGRGAVDKTVRGLLQHIYTEGWPSRNRGGRIIGLQKVRMVFEPGKLTVYENGELYFKTDEFELPFTKAYLYLQMKSHSNYPERTLYFDNVVVRQKKASSEEAVEAEAEEHKGEHDDGTETERTETEAEGDAAEGEKVEIVLPAP